VQPRESLAAFVVRVGFRIAVVAMLVLAAAHLGNEFVLDGRVEGLDADVEGNVFTWASSTATFAVAFCAALHAAAVEKQRREFTVLAALTLWFSMDDVAIIHERVAHKIGEDLFGLSDAIAVRLWLILYLPLLVLAALAEEGTNVPNELRIALEEGLELGGWILVAAGLTAILCSALMRTAPTSQ
jgi:hypothetical protein